jgi:hypothetical protein
MKFTSSAILLIIGIAACNYSDTGGPAGESRPEVDTLVDNYGSFVGHIGSLSLLEDGKYTCWVLNGATSDGCLSVVGSGSSQGTWGLEGDIIAFNPTSETNRLVLTFRGATALLTVEGVLLRIGDFEFPLKRGGGFALGGE